MKQILTFFATIAFTATLLAQSPQKFSYQAVIRDAENNLVTNQAVGMQISILQASATGTAVYVETQAPAANANGLVSIEIGSGTLESGDFGTINWAEGPFFIKTETDPAGGTNYSITGTSQLLSVPYALYSLSSGDSYWSGNNAGIGYQDGFVGLGTANPEFKFDINDNISDGNRTLLNIENKNTSSTSSAALEVKSGSQTNYTVLRMHGDNYSYSWWQKHGQLKTVGDGLIIEATKADKSGGDIIFVNGSTGGAANEKTVNMMINGDGNIGIGTDSPKEKLQIKSGDIYLEDVKAGIIMKSPDGGCWKMTVDNSGQPVFTNTVCP